MRQEGMRGFGEVYAMFERMDDFTDDEMCLLHCPEAPYFPLTEPLVNVRLALEHEAAELGLSEESARVLVAGLRKLWFGDRTHERIRTLMLEGGVPASVADEFLRRLKSCRAKTRDLERLLA